MSDCLVRFESTADEDDDCGGWCLSIYVVQFSFVFCVAAVAATTVVVLKIDTESIPFVWPMIAHGPIEMHGTIVRRNENRI